MNQTEEELERFRRQWRDEVSARNRHSRNDAQQSTAQILSNDGGNQTGARIFPRSGHLRNASDAGEDVAPQTYHDVEEKELGRRIDDDSYGSKAEEKEPQTGLEHYEKAVEKEGLGNLGESVNLYRKAFKLDPRVYEKYKNKYFPPSKPINLASQPTSPRHSTPIQHSLTALSPSISDLIAEFSNLSIPGEPAPTEFSSPPPCPISQLPEEILVDILYYVATTDVASFARLSQVCKRLAFLVLTEDKIWRTVTMGQEFGFAAMLYRFICEVDGSELLPSYSLEEDLVLDLVPLISTQQLCPSLSLTPTHPTYRQMFRSRPRIRFNGCYISTVNYSRPGTTANNQLTWHSPILIVTYYRYLRFFRDGTVISLLTTSEPADVVPYLHKEHLLGPNQQVTLLPQSVMKDALRGRWRLSGDPYGTDGRTASSSLDEVDEEAEAEGDVHVETDGVAPKYMYKMQLGLGSAGRGARNNKMSWKGYWSYNKLTDDWAEFTLKNDRAYYWSRVRSYGTGL